MTSIIRFTALSGAYSESALCYLLEIDKYRILLDCGWDETFPEETIEALRPHAASIDVVLVTYPDLPHLGALPYAYGKLGLRCKIYSTRPVQQMGQMFLYDVYTARLSQENFDKDTFTLDDVDGVFKLFETVKYSQTVALTGRGKGITITPYEAGHMVGGTFWKIAKDTEQILYAVDFNHRKERHLNGTVLETHNRPTLLITDAFNFGVKQEKRAKRDSDLVSKILSTLGRDGSVLLATDIAGRVLELLLLLDQAWTKAGLAAFPLIFLNSLVNNVLEFARITVEYMSDRLLQTLDTAVPFALPNVRLVRSLHELDRIPGPKVVLSSLDGLTAGLSQQLLFRWHDDPKNLLLFTSRPCPGSLGRRIWDQWNPETGELTSPNFEVDVTERVLLEGEELEQYQREEAERRDAEEKARQMEAQSEEDDDDDDAEKELMQHDLMKTKAVGKNRTFKQKTRLHPMFPYVEEKVYWDEYGEAINVLDFAAADTTEQHSQPEQQTQPEQAAALPVAPPTKIVASTKRLTLQCAVSYVDLEGRADGDSVLRILEHVKPRKMIVVHGPRERTIQFAEMCASSEQMNLSAIDHPGPGQSVDVTSEQNIYQVRLTDTLMSKLHFSKVENHELAWVDGILRMDMDEDGTRLSSAGRRDSISSMEGIAPEGLLPSLEAAPEKASSGHKSALVGEVRLSDFKQVLNSEGIEAVFSGGVLVCEGTVAVRKDTTGNVSLEGPVSPTYYAVRQLLYDQYAMV
eukprot:m.323696 g.323696  ORF g.323696 m.323696 type:complete len:745 (-) comp29922_c0_seq1:38-2272(-)